MPGASAVGPTWDKLQEVITAAPNPPLTLSGATILGPKRVYRGRAPIGAVLGYFLFGTVFEADEGFYMYRGQRATYRIHCWAKTADDAQRMFAWLKGLIHEVRLELTGFAMWIGGELVRVTNLEGEPDAAGIVSTHQVIADWTVETLEVAA